MLFFGLLLFVAFVLRLWLSGFGGVHPDEAYYWTWSLEPQLGYFDHPPMIAWLIGLGRIIVESVFPDELLAQYPVFFSIIKLKAGPMFMSTVLTPLFLGKCVEWVQRKALSVSQMFALLVTPIFLLGSQMVTPDIPLFFGWTLCLLAAIGFQKRRYHNTVLGDPTPPLIALSVLSGFALAFSAYSKYSAILAAFLLLMSGIGLWNAIMMAVVCLGFIFPYFLWMSAEGTREGAGVAFQFGNALGNPLKSNNFKFVGDLWASQIFLWTPFVFFSTFIFLFTDLKRFFLSHKSSRLSGTLFLWAIVPVMFFSLTALKRPAEANWPLVGIIAALVMTLSRLRYRPFWLSTLVVQNIGVLALSWMLLTQGHELSHLVEVVNPKIAQKLREPSRLGEFTGWDRLHTLTRDIAQIDSLPILVESYQVYSSLLFIDSSQSKELKIRPRLFYWNEGSRKSEFSRHSRYLLPEEKKSQGYWLLLLRTRKLPNCKIHQGLIKNVSETYFLYQCR